MIDIQKLEDVLSQIETRSDLEDMFNTANKCGFNLGSVNEAHDKHIAAILRKYNPLQLQEPHELSNPKRVDSENYLHFAKKCKDYFQHFSVEDAILQRMGAVSIEPKFKSYPRKKTKEEVIADGYKPHPEASADNGWYAYDLSNPLKLRFIAKQFEFNRLLELIGGPNLPYYSDYTYPDVPETDDFIIHPNRKIQFKNLELATKLRDLLVQKYQRIHVALIKY